MDAITRPLTRDGAEGQVDFLAPLVFPLGANS